MTLPNEYAANQVISETHNKIKEIIQKYDGSTKHDNLTTGDMVNIKLSVNGQFIDRLEQRYNESTEKQEKSKEDIEIVEVSDDLGISAKPAGATSTASQFAKEYSSRMQQSGFSVTPEFE